ncbi:MAG: hypothetical protein QM778_07005 [Myxococcales bacterium]
MVRWFLLLFPLLCCTLSSAQVAAQSATSEGAAGVEPSATTTQRPPPGTFLRPNARANGSARLVLDEPIHAEAKELPPLWPPIVLIATGGCGAAIGASMVLVNVFPYVGPHSSDEVDPSERNAALIGLGLLAVGGGTLVGGLVWLKHRSHERLLRSRMVRLMDPQAPASVRLMGAGLRVQFRI